MVPAMPTRTADDTVAPKLPLRVIVPRPTFRSLRTWPAPLKVCEPAASLRCPRISPEGYCDVWTFMYVRPALMAAT